MDNAPFLAYKHPLIAVELCAAADAWVAQSVEQGIENPRVGGSIPSPGTTLTH